MEKDAGGLSLMSKVKQKRAYGWWDERARNKLMSNGQLEAISIGGFLISLIRLRYMSGTVTLE